MRSTADARALTGSHRRSMLGLPLAPPQGLNMLEQERLRRMSMMPPPASPALQSNIASRRASVRPTQEEVGLGDWGLAGGEGLLGSSLDLQGCACLGLRWWKQ